MSSYEFTPKVGEPLDRETVHQQEQGFIAACQDYRCNWLGLFPDPKIAHEAILTHIKREKRSGENHFGDVNWVVLELVDDATARFVEGYEQVGGGRPNQYEIDHKSEWRRSTTDGETVADLVREGLHFDRNGYGEGVVVKCRARRACGLPTYNITFVRPDAEPRKDGTYSSDDYKFLNQLVAQDGDVYCQWEGDDPVLEPLGLADGHQLTFGSVPAGGD